MNAIIRKENNKGYIYYSALYADIGHAYAKLADELQEIVDVYFWGEYKGYTWREIADQIGCSTAGADRRRYKILETLAYEKGILI